MNNNQINITVDEIRERQAAIKKLQDEVDELKNMLKTELDERKQDSISTDLHNVFYHAYERVGVDSAKLKKEGMYDKYSKKSTVIEFRITDIAQATV